ncbi:hypothetical protein A3I42_04610 [Candidatus Uhrbacteria bacterium RIFCSPLOWO2_02_FULL_49_11]|uniref:Uncharacterized protein n=1 Tax=Candidatus Uhrbacteria bacterium RIFCSPLOWO2_02_FULL_49_11 TaxID=1802409 RepID=A0A1F7VCN9_9BACT|nr:MAG: hypothetical protein A3I42_04610 [Candidatus Uhrbacteria bacterium RIFCSPLOWO2_02_FULL_49_11]
MVILPIEKLFTTVDVADPVIMLPPTISSPAIMLFCPVIMRWRVIIVALDVARGLMVMDDLLLTLQIYVGSSATLSVILHVATAKIGDANNREMPMPLIIPKKSFLIWLVCAFLFL